MPSKSIFRQPGAKHFQLVHRSQRDPLINDPEASTHVLKPIEKEIKKGQSRADLESILTLDEISPHEDIGEASLYGIHFDNTEYDYMQHLRTVGTHEDGIESILIEVPATSKRNAKAELTSKKIFDTIELPDGVLASGCEMPRNFEMQQAIPDTIAGFQPDLDPHLRQALEALDDDAFVDENLDDDFFSKLVADGERGSDEDIDFELTAEDETDDNINGVEEDSWERRFSDFQKRQKNSLGSGSDFSDGDTVRELPAISVIGGKKRRKGSSEASGYSMSSSSMYRNEALQTLDERFDQIMLKEYRDKSDDQTDISKDDGEQPDETPELITSRSDFDSMVNDFLDNYEILGRKMRLKLEGETGPEKLEILRRSMTQGQISKMEIEEDEEDIFLSEQEHEKAKWDCETVLTTYTNLGNHPRLIRARDSKPVPVFQLDHKTGLPSVLTVIRPKQRTEKFVHTFAELDVSEKTAPLQQTTARDRNESKEDKRQRKTAVKQGKQARRTERKTMKQQFGIELNEQKKRLGSREQTVKKL